ncbi:MAG: hypothetical protein KAT58_09160, partial [candidate division Zixibacteria bacterium]|nr:hypothetical protein [candidate division Zixibacteria bacterium]
LFPVIASTDYRSAVEAALEFKAAPIDLTRTLSIEELPRLVYSNSATISFYCRPKMRAMSGNP